MQDKEKLIQEKIMMNMSEGILTMGFDGTINYVNPAALQILGLKEDIFGQKFAMCFLGDDDNDEFVQVVLDAAYDRTRSHEAVVSYETGGKTKQLRVVSSFLQDGGERAGVIIVFSDLSELMDLRDAVKSMEKIRSLNRQLTMRNNLLSETFGRFLSDDIVKELLDTPGGLNLGGRNETVTILMSDLRGFTAMSGRMDPADLITMLNHYLAEMTEAIQKWNGTIIEFMGDGIFAIFGAPVHSDRHASDAVAAALDMQERMDGVNRWNMERSFPLLEMGIGINTGEVIVGNIGSEKRTKYGVVGSNVNLTGRIESYTIEGQILISDSTRTAAEVELEIAKEIIARPKGVDSDIRLSQITGIGGDYNIHLSTRTLIPQELDRIIPVTFYAVEGKHNSDRACFGGITHLAQDMAVMSCAHELPVFSNIVIDAGGDLYCKVMENNNGEYLLHFTSVPAGYRGWLQKNVGII